MFYRRRQQIIAEPQDLMASVLQRYIQGLGTITPLIEGRIIKLA